MKKKQKPKTMKNTKNTHNCPEKLKYDSFLNGIERIYREYYTGNRETDIQLLSLTEKIIEHFTQLYADDPRHRLKRQTQKIVLDTIMFLN